MTEGTCAACTGYRHGVCEAGGLTMGSPEAACERHRVRRADGGNARTGIKCPNCGGQVGLHAGHIDDGRVFVCEKGKPPMREAKYHCGNCNSAVISPKECEPGVTGQ